MNMKMSSKETKRYFKIGEHQLTKLRNIGMPCELIGARYFYDRKEIEKWAEENNISSLGYNDSKLISTQDLQDILGVSKDITDKWLKLGCPRTTVHRKKNLYNMQELTEWLGLPAMDKHYVGTLMTAQEIADEFFVSIWTVRNWIKRGMPYYNFNKRVHRFDLEKVQEWLDNEN